MMIKLFEEYSRKTVIGGLGNRVEKERFIEFFDTYNSLKMSDADIKKLIKLDKEYEEIRHPRKTAYMKEITNLEEEKDKFFNELKKGKKYNPIFRHHPQPYDRNKMAEKAKNLIKEFQKFDCFLSKYYIERLEFLVTYAELKKMDMRSIKYGQGMLDLYGGSVDPRLVSEAKTIISQNPYKKERESQDFLNANELKKIAERELKILGYDKWKVTIEDNILPRMCVKDTYTVNINKNAKFGKNTISGLLAHELAGHVGRRFYGEKTGLNLFRGGLTGKNQFDEGLAIYNSLQVKDIKPNVLFNIAFFVLLADKCTEMDFYDLFKYGKNYIKNNDDKLFSKVTRIKRICEDTAMLFGDIEEQEYLSGYLLVNKMSDEQRDEILKFNVGPDNFSDLDRIKAFLNLNSFHSTTNKE